MKIKIYDIKWDCPASDSDFDRLPKTVNFSEEYDYIEFHDFTPDMAMKVLTSRYGWTISSLDFVFEE